MELRKLPDYAVELLHKIVSLPSSSGDEQEIGDFLENELKNIGFLVTRDHAGNVIARTGQGEPRILLCGHMDTVPEQIPVQLTEDTLHGRGSVDAKGSLAALIVAASELSEEEFTGSLIVAGVVEEEGRNLGVKTLIDADLDVDYAVFGEPTNVDTLTVAYKGVLILEVTCTTETGHSSAPWLFSNAIEHAMNLYHTLERVTTGLSPQKDGFDSVSTCLRRIEGGANSGTVPSSCKMIIEYRIPPGQTVKSISEAIKNGRILFESDNPTTLVNTRILDTVEPYLCNTKSKLVKAFTRTIYLQNKKRVKLVRKTGSGDMNFYGAASTIPIITYGPGDPHLDHTPNEHIKIQDYLDSIHILKESLRRLSVLHNQN